MIFCLHSLKIANTTSALRIYTYFLLFGPQFMTYAEIGRQI
uniref:Uncharacterized protein n=1 Tax=Arundo donax TaxID=35708 RepID=A0A0A9B899_ARUDO